MEMEEKVRIRLMERGFNYNEILNNRGLIGAVIEDTIIEFTKTFNGKHLEKLKEESKAIDEQKRITILGALSCMHLSDKTYININSILLEREHYANQYNKTNDNDFYLLILNCNDRIIKILGI